MYGNANNFTSFIPLEFRIPLNMPLCDSMYLSRIYMIGYGIPCTLAY